MRLIRILNVIRYNDWWLYKVPTLLAIFYATLSLSGYCIADNWIEILKLLFYICSAAIYVCIINDISDKKLDEGAGKSNIFTKLPSTYSVIILATTILLQVIVLIILLKHKYAAVLYMLSLISYSLYSIPPFRFKLNKYLGVLADALGAHCFASIFVIAYAYGVTKINLDPKWVLAITFWSLSYGIRGIIWHQFIDKDADLKTGIRTLGNSPNTKSINTIVSVVFIVETIFLLYIIYCFKSWVVFIFFLIYLFFLITRHYLYNSKIIMARPYSQYFQIIFAEYYEFYFPISILILNTQNCSISLFVLIFQLLLFPNRIFNLFIYLKDIFRRLLNKL